MPLTINDLSDLQRLLEERPEWQEALARLLLNKRTLTRLAQSDPELIATLRQLIVQDALDRLTEAVAELVEISQRSLQWQEQTSARLDRQEVDLAELKRIVGELVETSRQSVARLDRQEAEIAELRRVTAELVEISRQSLERLDALERRSERVEQGVDELQSWRRREEGRRGGERYQLNIRRQAWQLLAGGVSGFPEEPQVEKRLRQWLPPSPDDGFMEDEVNPALADLIWWKGEEVAIVDVSLKVNGRDVQRARARADTLRRAGVNVRPIVIGNEWAHPDSRRLAEQEQVEWKVGNDLSPGYIEFRKITPVE